MQERLVDLINPDLFNVKKEKELLFVVQRTVEFVWMTLLLQFDFC